MSRIGRGIQQQVIRGTPIVETGGVGAISPGSMDSGPGGAFVNGASTGRTTSPQTAIGFIPSTNVTAVSLALLLKKAVAPADNLVVTLQTDSAGSPSGTILATLLTVAGSALSTTVFTQVSGSFKVDLVGGTQYWIVFSRDGAADDTNFYRVATTDGSANPTYTYKRFSGSWSAPGDTPSYAFSLLTAGDTLAGYARNVGPQPPLLSDHTPVVTTLSVNLASGLLTNQRRMQLRRGQVIRGTPIVETGGVGAISPGNPRAANIQYGRAGGNTSQVAVSFVPSTNATAISLEALLLKVGSPTDNTIVTLQSDSGGSPSGTVLATLLTVAGASLTTTAAQFSATFSTPLIAGTTYWVVFGRDGALDSTNNYRVVQVDGDVTHANPTYAFKSFLASWGVPAGQTPAYFSLLTAGDNIAMLAWNIGPQPPLVIDPGAQPPVVTTISATFASGLFTNQRRAQQRFPRQWYEGSETDVGSPRPNPASIIVYPERALGPDPPQVINAPPLAPPIQINLASGVLTNQRRAQQRFPLQGWTGDAHLVTASPVGASPSTLYRGGWVYTGGFQPSGQSFEAKFASRLFVPWNTSSFNLVVALKKFGSPTDNLVISIQGDSGGIPDGNILASFSVASGSLLNNTFLEFASVFNVSLVAFSEYWIVFARDGAIDNSNYYAVPQVGVLTQAVEIVNPLYGAMNFSSVTSAWSAIGGPGQASAYWKVTPLDGSNAGTPILRRNLGPKPPEYTIQILPVPVAPVAINLATGLLTNQRRYEQRKPHSFLFVVQQLAQPPPVVTTLLPATLAVQSRLGALRRFPLQGWDETEVFIEPGFPATRIIDTFPYASANGLVIFGDWTVANGGGVFTGGGASSGLRVGDYFPQTINPSSATCGNFAGTVYGPDCELRLDLVQLPGNTAHQVQLFARVTNPSNASTINSYMLRVSASGIWDIRKAVAGAFTTLQTTTQAIAAGDKIGFRVVGTQLTAWWFNGATGLWTLVAQTTDSDVSGSGQVGITMAGAGDSTFWVGDNFGGGTLTDPSSGFGLSVLTRRRLGPFPPVVLGPVFAITEIAEPSLTAFQAVAARVARQQRAPHSDLFGFIPQVSAQPPPPISVNCLQPDRLARRFHRAPPVPGGSVFPPTVLQTFAGPTVTLVRTRPRHFAARIIAPATLQPYAVTLAEDTVRVALVRTRPRHTLGTRLGYTVYPATGRIAVTLVKTRPRPTHVAQRGLIFYAQADYTILVQTVRTRPRPTTRFVKPPATLQPYAVTVAEDTVRVALAHTRPRPTTRRIAPPAVLQVFTGPATPRVRTRPRPTTKFVAPPATLQPYAVTLAEDTIRVTVVRTRPRHTLGTKLGPLIFYAQTSDITVTLVRTRPRPTSRSLGPLIFYAQAGVGFTHLVRTRPRPTTKFFTPTPITVAAVVYYGPQVVITRTRPRHVVSRLSPPFFYAATSVITVTLARTRPRPTRHALTAVTYPQTGVGFTHLVRTRPRPTTRFVAPPATLQPYAVTVQEDTVHVVLVRTRPRPTTRRLAPPTTLQIFAGPATHLVKTRPRPTHIAQRGLIFYAVADTTIFVQTVRARPRPTTRFLAPPATLQPYAVTLAEDTIRVALVRTRPRHTVGTKLSYTVYAATSEISVTLVRTRPRPTTRKLAPPSALQVFGPPVEIEIAVRTPLEDRRRQPHSKLSPPTFVIPVGQVYYGPTVYLRRIRPVRTHALLSPPTVLQVFAAPETPLVHTRPRPTTAYVSPPATLEPESVEIAERTIRVLLVRTRPRHTVGTRLSYVVYAATSEIAIALVRTRPRPTTRRLTAISYAQTGVGFTHLVRTRPRHTVAFLSPPNLEAESVQIAERTIRVLLVRTRPRPKAALLGKPTTLQIFTGPEVSLTKTRPRPTRRFLNPPTVVRVPSVEQQEQTVRVTLVHTRPRPTEKTLRPPTVIRIPSVEQREDTITTRLVTTRPRPTAHFIIPPLVKTFPPVVTTFPPTHLVVTRPRPTTTILGPPTVVIPLPTLRMQTVQVALTRIRPRPTRHTLGPLVFYRQTSTIKVTLTRVRPRPTTAFLSPPTTLRTFGPPVEVEIAVRTPVEDRAHRRPRSFAIKPFIYAATSDITVAVVRTRPRPTTKALRPPAVVQFTTFNAPATPLVHTRPRATRYIVRPPATLQPYSVTVAEDTIRVLLARTRPRATRRFIAPPTVVQRFVVVTPTRALVVTRPRKTHAALAPPTVVRTFVAAPILVTTVKTRPRPQSATIEPPTRLRPSETTIRVHLTRIRPRPTKHIEPFIAVESEPPVVTTFLPTHLVQTRPRPTHHFLTPFTTYARPVTVFHAPPILVVTVRIRPPHIRSIRVTPFPFFPGRDGFTTSTVVATAGGADSAVVVTGGALDSVVTDDADSTIIVVTGGDIEDTLTDGGEILDRPGGLT